MLDDPINVWSFTTYGEQLLLPTLSPGDIVVMDNFGSHRGDTSDSSSVRPAPGP